MSDQFTESTTVGYGSRILGSFQGILVGILLFVGSFALLYWNEGRVDLLTIAKTAQEMPTQEISANASLEGVLITANGIVTSEEMMGDDLFLKPGNYLSVERKVEMYGWVERSESRSTTNLGGSETTETTYTYAKDWTENPEATGNFKHPEGHENPQKLLDSTSKTAASAKIGVYTFDPTRAQLPGVATLELGADNATPSQGAVLANNQYLYISKTEGSTMVAPQVGDMRVQYRVLRPGFNGTLFGAKQGDRIVEYAHRDGNTFYRLFLGSRNEAIATFHSEYTTMLWILRLVGFCMMWIGLSSIFGPISVLLDVVPIFGSISRALISGIAFVAALPLSILTIFVSMVLQSIIALVVVVVLAITILSIIYFTLRYKKMAAR